ncbi:MAG: hypothetical protein GKS01_00695 [Alphaproteobacteria bacterium]|nr:hypothetical protein [Alphaproteobacteria bacterium]
MPRNKCREGAGLRVCDAAIMPIVSFINTNLPVIKFGKKIAT